MPATVEFFFDFNSAYSYLASTQIEKLCARHGAALVWKPMVLGAVLKATDNRAPYTVPAKLKWMLGDLERWKKRYGIDLNFPSNFPANSILALRTAVLAEELGGKRELIHSIFRAYWVDERDLADPAVVKDAIARVGLDAETYVARATEQPIKDRLRAYTDDAVARGAFGAPAIFVGEEFFWGNDRLEFVEEVLRRGHQA